MSKLDALLDELVESQVETLVQPDSYYEVLATPLKPAAIIKKEHKKQLIEFFKMTELRSKLEKAPDLIMNLLPQLVSLEEFDKIKNELDKSGEHFVNFIESMPEDASEKVILFQEMFGLSDDTLLHIYDLAVDLVKKENYQDANTLFIFLTTLAPHVASYWLAQGVCYQALDRHEEAVAVFDVAKFLTPDDPAPVLYTIQSYQALKDEAKAKDELKTLEDVVKSLKDDEKKTWELKIKEINIQ